MSREVEILICDCNSTDHQIVIMYSEEDCQGMTYPICYAHVHLSPMPFWKRLRNGIRYIFGRRSKYGDFEEFMFSPLDAEKLQKLVNYLNGTQSNS